MKSPLQCTRDHLQIENEKLKERITEFEHIEQKYEQNLRQLTEKEAFNFALFQYNPSLTLVVDREGRIVKTNAAKKRYGGRIPNIGDVMYKDYASRHNSDMYQELMDAMESNTQRHFDELSYDDKILSVTIAPFPQGAIIISADITNQKKAERDLCAMVNDLKRALDEVETLRGLLPICAGCKKIRDDNGYWNHIEVYFGNHSHVDFTHTLCPDCISSIYPEYWEKRQERAAIQENLHDDCD